MTAYSLIAMLHAGLGVVALGSFWIAGLSRKGSPLHRGAGKVYLPAMAALLVLALPLGLTILAYRSTVFGAFLLYLEIIAATGVWLSWRAVRDKRDFARYTGRTYHVLAWLNLIGGVAIAAIGVFVAQSMQLVIVSFSLIGLVSFVQMRRFARTPPEDPRWWLREHLTAMLGNGVATHIAFLSLGLPRLFPDIAGPVLQNVAWLGPIVVAMGAGVYLVRKYVPKRAPRAVPAPATPIVS